MILFLSHKLQLNEVVVLFSRRLDLVWSTCFVVVSFSRCCVPPILVVV